MPRRSLVLCLFLLTPFMGWSQAVDNALSFNAINAPGLFRATYENDVFNHMDKYYTQGIRFELASPSLSKFPLNKLLLHPLSGLVQYGIALEHDVYTPSSITGDSILHGDRPFAACLMASTFATTIDTIRHRRFYSSLSVGVIGPAAFGEQMQTYIHKHINSALPHGWDNQIENDVLLNYELRYEQQLFAYRHYLSLNAEGMARAGTLSDKASAGVTVMAGHFASPYAIGARHKNWNIYVYGHLHADIIGYDATLQGGLFNRGIPYYISTGDISRFTLETRIGMVVQLHRLHLEYHCTHLSKESTTGTSHSWGGLQIAVRL